MIRCWLEPRFRDPLLPSWLVVRSQAALGSESLLLGGVELCIILTVLELKPYKGRSTCYAIVLRCPVPVAEDSQILLQLFDNSSLIGLIFKRSEILLNYVSVRALFKPKFFSSLRSSLGLSSRSPVFLTRLNL